MLIFFNNLMMALSIYSMLYLPFSTLFMIKLVFSVFFFCEALSASISPLVSKLGEDSFRSGEVAVALGNQSEYDFVAPFTRSLPDPPVKVVLSIADINQAMDSSLKIWFHLMEDTPFSSNGSHAVFRVKLGFSSLTSRAKVKYLGYPASIISTNFYIFSRDMIVGTLLPGNQYVDTVITPFNTTLDNTYVIWFSGIEAYKSSAGDQIYINTWFLIPSGQIRLSNTAPNPVHFGIIRVTIVLMNYAVITMSGSIRLPIVKWFSSLNLFPLPILPYNTWWQITHIICGHYHIRFSSNFF